MIKNKPLFNTLLFSIYPIIFFLSNYINYSRAGKILFTGMATIGLLSAIYYKAKPNKTVYAVLILVSFILFLNLSFQAVLRDIFGVAQDEMMIMKAIFGTDVQESYEFILQYRPFLLKHIIIFALSFGSFYMLALRRSSTKQYKVSKKNLLLWVLVFIVFHLEKSIRKGNPFVYFPVFFMEYKSELNQLNKLTLLLKKNADGNIMSSVKYIGDTEKNTFVWVIGESSTRYNWSLYGYDRNTTPLMNSIKSELLVFENIKAAAPITVPAFEMMFTSASKKRPNLWKKNPSIIQIAKQAGYRTYWISNHTTDAHNGIIHIFSKQANENYMTNKGKARGEGSYDESVFSAYKKALSDNYNKKLIIVHLLGSHPAYNFRYPKEYSIFTDVFDDNISQELTAKGIASWAITFRNFYDNSVLYGDYIRYTLLNLLQHSKEAPYATWLYHPDHGEDVCHHDNFSGHNPNVKEQWDIPMVFWSAQKRDIDTSMPYSLDTIESSILGLLHIETSYYHEKWDYFKE